MPPKKLPSPASFRSERAPAIGSSSSIRVVSEVTGIPLDTLRAWERRYGFPKPLRREDSNRRLYSAGDVERLTWVARALERGYRPGDVIEKAPAEIRALLGEAIADVRPAREAPGDLARPDAGTLMERLLRNDVAGIEADLRFAAAALGPRRFVTDIAHPLSIAVGAAWAEGKLAIRHEHLMTECLVTQLRLLLAAQQDSSGGPVVVLATLPTEPHTLGLQMAAVYLAVSSVRPRLLGANTPPGQVLEAVHAFGAAAVGVTVTEVADPASTRRALRALARDLPRHAALWVGGGAAARFEASTPRVRCVGNWGAMDTAIHELGEKSRAR